MGRPKARLWSIVIPLTILLLGWSPTSGRAQFSDYRKDFKLDFKPAFHKPGLTILPGRLGKSGVDVQVAIEPLVESVTKSVVGVQSERGQVCLGTIVSSDGLVITKLSLLSKQNSCQIDDTSYVLLRVAAYEELDLALVKIELEGDQRPDFLPVVFSPSTAKPTVGKFVVSVNENQSASTLGVLTVVPQELPIKQPVCKNCVDFGVIVQGFRTEPVNQDQSKQFLGGLKVTRVYPRTASEKCGLLVGDLVHSVNGKRVASRSDLDYLVSELRVGQNLNVTLVRDQRVVELSTIVHQLSPQIVHDRWGGGPFSEIRFGFGTVLIHDCVIEPKECGGPVVGLDGKLLGINIARSLRVASFAIEAEKVKQFILSVDPMAKIRVGD